MNIAEVPDKEADYSVPALARGLSVLGMFNTHTRSLSLQEIAERLGVSNSAVYRILFTLTNMGYLNKHNTQYELGARVISDGFSYLASRDIVEVAMRHLNELRDRTSLSCHLSIREQTDSLYLYRAFAAQRLSVNIPVGTRIACHCTAMGRMLLTSLSEIELGQLYQLVRLDDYPAPAPRTLLELQNLISEDRDRGWVLHRSDYSTAIAAPIRDHNGHVVAAINLSGPDAVMDSEDVKEQFRALLLASSVSISNELGYSHPFG
ncbi:helix-turn-helix domain-containing protein [Pseudomonas sp. FSL R10-2245]|uniref:IclR family transcriptional regulator n=1 Tax=Pseudomonas sp. FSL R10-2245 TaxID=2662200 RepID=UPI001294E2CE|nr:IclR family transcriptional regulator [Pseudomonas sp. FSL R10-2245]MQT99326.1 helix-turn-helix domain-containing protein [Pseudomonas sp. FSL R10-2245]